MRVKTLAILMILAAAVVLADGLAERAIVLPQFLALERQEAQRNMERVRNALDRELDQLARSARDYAEWDDACRFVEARDADFIRSNLQPRLFVTFRLNLLHFYDAAGRLAWGETRDCDDGSPMTLVGLPAAGFPQGSPLVQDGPSPRSLRGLVTVGGRLMLAASQPVVASDGSGPVRGTVVFGRLFSPADEQALRVQTEVMFSIVPADEAPQAATAGDGEICVIDDTSDESLRAYAPLRGLDGQAAWTFEAETPRHITAEGRALVRNESLWMIGAALVLLAGAYASFGFFVVGPVRRLTRHVLWIRQSGDLTRRLDLRRADEVGTLAREFDLLLAQLDRSRAAHLKSENRLKSALQEQMDLVRRFMPDEAALAMAGREEDEAAKK